MKDILIGTFKQEGHSFVPGRTTREDFAALGVRYGQDCLGAQDRSETHGFEDVAAARGVRLVPTVYAHATSGPPVTDDAFETFADAICDNAGTYLSDLSGIALSLHGAMMTESYPDAEGELLHRLRTIVGRDLPIAVTFDLHAHMTQQIADLADIVVAFQTIPHVDLYETGSKAMSILIDAIEGAVSPRLSFFKLPMLSAPECQDSRRGAYKELMDELRQAEEDATVLSASLLSTQAYVDVPNLGWSTVVVTDGDQAEGDRLAVDIAREAWKRRRSFVVDRVPVDQAIDEALSGEGCFALSEGADSPTAGGLGDGTELLAALLRRKVDVSCLLMVRDAEVVEIAAQAGIGAAISVDLGGKLTPRFFSPVPVTGRVKALTDGRYWNLYAGERIHDMGHSAVLEIGSITVLVSSERPRGVDYQAYLSVGQDPRRFKISQPKSAGSYKQYYEEFARCIDIDTTGPVASNLTLLDYQNRPIPLWPWEDTEHLFADES